MKILVFAACVTVAVAMVPMFENIELHRFRKNYYECCEKLGCVEDKYPGEVTFCATEKYDSSIFRKDGTVIWKKLKGFLEQIIPPEKQSQSITIVRECVIKACEEGGSIEERVIKIAYCSRDVMKLIIEDI